MNLRFVVAISLPALALSAGAMADQPATPVAPNNSVQTVVPTHPAAQPAPAATMASADVETLVEQPAALVVPDSIIQTAMLTEQAAHLASAVRIASAAILVRADGRPSAMASAIHAKLSAREPADRSAKLQRGKLADASKAMCVQPVGRAETGTAAWYGGRYIGRQTSSGSRLDTVHLTAAHRTLPLNSLARVTNLDNGRSVVVRVTDRGPISNSLLIDMSPKAADELQMKHAGIVPVRVEQVVEVPTDPK